jgi:organic hydroperoxide reductase OsmC/OhrA
MQPFPHHYSVIAKADTQGDVALAGDRLPPIPSAPPTEFGGPGDRWSPETLFVAAVADCFVLTFRGIAGGDRGAVKTVIFACVHNAGRSQMPAAFFNKLADPAKARAMSAGTAPGDRVYPDVVAVMQDEGIDLSGVGGNTSRR